LVDQSVTAELTKEAAALRKARSHWFAAEYSKCLDLIKTLKPCSEASLLAANAAYRLRNFDDALVHVRGSRQMTSTPTIRLEADALGSVLYELVGDSRESDVVYEEFDQLGFDWRAAQCALFLYRAGCGKKWIGAAKEKARNYPRSFIGAQLQAAGTDASCEALSVLTPRQRQVLRRIVDGDTAEEAAEALNAKPTTIKVHIRRIYEALAVRNRLERFKRVSNLPLE
jgi:DNA-binding CsgD family transcriptional regulator